MPSSGELVVDSSARRREHAHALKVKWTVSSTGEAHAKHLICLT